MQIINGGSVVALILAVITLFIQIFVNERKTPQQGADNQNVFMDFIMRSVFLVTNVSSHFIFYYMLISTGYIQMQYKQQDALRVMLPDGTDRFSVTFKWYLYTLFGTQMVTMLLRLYKQCACEYYFLDFEQTDTVKSINKWTDDKTSCWRRLFVANELCKLFTTRQIVIELTLFIYLILT